MKKKIPSLYQGFAIVVLLGLVESATAQWTFTGDVDPVNPAKVRIGSRDLELPISSMSLPDQATPLLQELARNLDHDPLEIYRFVRNEIDYVPYYGIMKGAEATYLDRMGNDADQATLLGALLQASGYTVVYKSGVMTIPTWSALSDNVLDWLDVDSELAAIQLLASSGVPVTNNLSTFDIARIWVSATIEGGVYELDPAFEQWERRPEGPDLMALAGYDRGAFLSAAGGTANQDWVNGMDFAAITNYLAARTRDLSDALAADYTGVAWEELLGLSRKQPWEGIVLPTVSAFDLSQVTSHATPPQSLLHTLRVRHGDIDEIFPFSELAGKNVSLSFDDSWRGVALPSPTAPTHGPTLLVPAQSTIPSNVDVWFGDVYDLPDSPSVVHDIVFTNKTGSTLYSMIIRLAGNNYTHPVGGFSFKKYRGDGYDLPATHALTATVTFAGTSTASRGLQVEPLEFSSYPNGSRRSEKIVSVGGVVRQSPVVTNDSHGINFGPVAYESPSIATAQLKNDGLYDVTVTNMDLVGLHAHQFQILTGGDPGIIGPGEARNISIQYHAGSIADHTAAIRVQFVYDGAEYEWSGLTLSGQSRQPPAQLWVDGQLLAEETNGFTSIHSTLLLDIDHPYAAWSGSHMDDAVSYPLKRGSHYVILTDFGSARHGHYLRTLESQLDALRAGGHMETDRQLIHKSLQLVGQTWMRQSGLTDELIDGLYRTRRVHHHRVGVMAQEAGYYIDIKAQNASAVDRALGFPSSYMDSPWLLASSLFQSALEHGTLEQLQGKDRPALSTTRLLGLASWAGHKIFLLDATNAPTYLPQLVNYEFGSLTNIQTAINAGQTLLVPQNGHLTMGDWTGYGYAAFGPDAPGSSSIVVSMKIGGDHDGGYSAYADALDSGRISHNTVFNTEFDSTVSVALSSDPVDFATGAFITENTSLLSHNGDAPLSLTRSYRSDRRLPGPLGIGWTHNHLATHTLRSGGEAGFGLAQPRAASSLLLAAVIIRDLLEAPDSPKTWLLAARAAEWGIDQQTETTHTLRLGNQTLNFTALPDGSFVPPPGMDATIEHTQPPITYGPVGSIAVPADYDNDGVTDLAVIHPSGDPNNWPWHIFMSSSGEASRGWGYTGCVPVPADYDGDGIVDLAVINTNTWDWYISKTTTGSVTQQFGYVGCIPIPGDYDDDDRADFAVYNPSIAKWYVVPSGGDPFIEFIWGPGNAVPVPADRDGDGRTDFILYNPVDFTWHIRYAAGSIASPLTFGESGASPFAVDLDGDGRADLAYYNPTTGILNANLGSNGLYQVYLGVVGGSPIFGDFDGDGRNELGLFDPPTAQWHILGVADNFVRLHQPNDVVYEFDNRSLLTRVTDPYGLLWGYNYFSNSNIFAIANRHKQLFVFGYTEDRLTSVADQSGRVVSFGYTDGLLTSTGDEELYPTTYQYDTSDRLSRIVNASGIATISNRYSDTTGRVLDQTGVYGRPYEISVIPQYRSRETFPDGSSDTVWFDERSRPYGRQNALGDVTLTSYDAENRPISVMDPDGHIIRTTYSDFHTPLTVTDPLTNTTVYTYDQEHRLVSATDPLGHTISNTWTATHRLASHTDPLGHVVAYTYNEKGLPDTIQETVSGMSRLTQIDYNAQGLPVRTEHADATVTSNTWDRVGNLLAAYDGNHRLITATTYDKRRLPTSVQDALGNVISNRYDPRGLLVSHTDPKGALTSNTWTHSERLATIRFPDGTIVSNTYNDLDRLIAVTDARGNESTYHYDAIGRRTNSHSAYVAHSYQYDNLGNLTHAAIDPEGLNLWTETVYDPVRRPITTSNRLATTKRQYDPLGRVTNLIDQVAQSWSAEYNANGRKTKDIRPSGAGEIYLYDAVGNRIGFYNAENNAIVYGFDTRNRITAITNAIGNVTRFSYDEAGNVSARIDAKNETTHYAYDPVNRLTNIVHEGVWRASFVYDANGNQTANTAEGVGVTFGYDAMNRMTASTQHVQSLSFAFSYGYDDNGNRTNIGYPGGLNVGYSYDEDNRLVDVTVTPPSAPTRTFTFQYDTASRMSSMVYPNGINASFVYDAESRMVRFTHGDILDHAIERDPRGYKVREDTYTGLVPDFSNHFSQVRSHNGADQLIAAGEATFAYDANGNVTNTSGDEYQWNYDNRLLSTTDSTYLYDGSGIRVGSVSTSTTRYFLVDYRAPLKMPLAEADETGAIVRYFIWSSYGLLAHLDMDPATHTIIATRYYHADELGSTLALTDESGVLTDRFAYSPYGQVLCHQGDTDTPYQWLGGIAVRHDGEGLYYMLNRYYSATLSRFLSSDPLGIDGGPNLYLYANGNPLWFIDPLGLAVIFGHFNGQYTVTTTAGDVYRNSTDYRQLSLDLQTINDSGQQISAIEIVGHGTPEMITFGGGYIVRNAMGHIIDPDQNDLTGLIRDSIAPNANINLIGCNTARGDDNIARSISTTMPNVNVKGFTSYGLGGVNFGIYHSLGTTKTYEAQHESAPPATASVALQQPWPVASESNSSTRYQK